MKINSQNNLIVGGRKWENSIFFLKKKLESTWVNPQAHDLGYQIGITPYKRK